MVSSRSTRGFVAALFVLFATSSAAEPAPPFAEEAFRDLLGAIQARAIDEFVALGDKGFEAMPKSEFESLAAKFAPMLSSGYSAAYLAEFRQKDSTVYYWKLTFDGDPDDWLAKLGVRDGKLLGFLIQRP